MPLRKRYLILILLAAVFWAGCARKSGCPATENLRPKVNRKGEFKRSRTKSHLFSKKMRKRMRKHKH